MASLSPALPLTLDKKDGYKMNKNIKDVIKQNFKMLVLTSPGERIMLPNFGVGLRRFLFEPMTTIQFGKIESRIENQIEQYMPFLSLIEVKFLTQEQDPSILANEVSVSVKYAIPSINTIDEINLKLYNKQF
jgi:phage baseplate assembly protein W